MDEVANLVAGVVEFIVGVPNLADEVAGPASRSSTSSLRCRTSSARPLASWLGSASSGVGSLTSLPAQPRSTLPACLGSEGAECPG